MTAAFEQWATQQGVPVSHSACGVDPDPSGGDLITCFGLVGYDGDGFASVVVATLHPSPDDTVDEFAWLPAGVPPAPVESIPVETSEPEPATADGPTTTFGDGTWVVGVDIEPGYYHTDAPGGCEWVRTADLDGREIIDDDLHLVPGGVFVQIEPTDALFITRNCGVWALESAITTDDVID
jgi:hypothetical protein